jgi:hypothetical protein
LFIPAQEPICITHNDDTMDHLHFQEILREILSFENNKQINITIFEGSRDATVQKMKQKITVLNCTCA